MRPALPAIAALLASLLGATASAQPPADEPPVLSNPEWISRPTPTQLSSVFPQRALRKKVSGVTIIKCRVTATGTMTDCALQTERPADYGFGDAALKLAKYFVIKPHTRDGQPVAGATITIPVMFKMR